GAQQGQVKVDYVFEAGALNFDRHGLARMQSRAIDLSERRGGYRLRTDFRVKLVERPPQFALDDPHRFVMLERRHAVLQFTQLFDVGQRQQVGARRNRLADLDEGRAEFQQLSADPFSLPSQMPLFRFILFADEPLAVVSENKKLI